MKRTLPEKARIMRLHTGLQTQFLTKVVDITTYLIDREPSIPLEHMILEEIWSGKEVSLSYLNVFGCVSYVHISDQARNKLDVKSLKCIFIGYGGKTLVINYGMIIIEKSLG